MNDSNDNMPDAAAENETAAPGTQVEENPIEENKDARTWGMMAHLSAMLAAILTGFLGGFIGPLIVWLVKKNEHPFVDDQGKEALNFQLTLLIAYVIAIGIVMVSCGVLFFVYFVPILLQFIFGIIGAMKANEGIYYRYPFNIRLIS